MRVNKFEFTPIHTFIVFFKFWWNSFQYSAKNLGDRNANNNNKIKVCKKKKNKLKNNSFRKKY